MRNPVRLVTAEEGDARLAFLTPTAAARDVQFEPVTPDRSA